MPPGEMLKLFGSGLKKQYADTSGLETVKLALRAVLELVEPSSKNIEVAIVDRKGLRIMPSDDIDEIVKLIEDEKEYADKQRKN